MDELILQEQIAMFSSTHKCKACEKDIDIDLDVLVKVVYLSITEWKRWYYHHRCFPSATSVCPDCGKRLGRASFSNVNCFVCRNRKCRSFWKK